MAEKKFKLFQKIKNYFHDYKIEIKKIVWPKPKQVFRNTGIVLSMIIIVGIFVFLIDTGLMNLFGMIMSVSK